jgi:hypothetical protein
MLSTINRNDDPTILTARREMQSWRRLALEPSALRTSDRYTDPSEMQPDGLHLPRSLDRIARKKSPDDPARIWSRGVCRTCRGCTSGRCTWRLTTHVSC